MRRKGKGGTDVESLVEAGAEAEMVGEVHDVRTAELLVERHLPLQQPPQPRVSSCSSPDGHLLQSQLPLRWGRSDQEQSREGAAPTQLPLHPVPAHHLLLRLRLRLALRRHCPLYCIVLSLQTQDQ